MGPSPKDHLPSLLEKATFPRNLQEHIHDKWYRPVMLHMLLPAANKKYKV
jgi:hypothetical protein